MEDAGYQKAGESLRTDAILTAVAWSSTERTRSSNKPQNGVPRCSQPFVRAAQLL